MIISRHQHKNASRSVGNLDLAHRSPSWTLLFNNIIVSFISPFAIFSRGFFTFFFKTVPPSSILKKYLNGHWLGFFLFSSPRKLLFQVDNYVRGTWTWPSWKSAHEWVIISLLPFFFIKHFAQVEEGKDPEQFHVRSVLPALGNGSQTLVPLFFFSIFL